MGIDLGTTNSLAAVYSDSGEILLVKNHNDEVLTPSVVSLTDNNELLVGRGAKSRLVLAPDRSAAAFKRAIGTTKEFKLGRTGYSAIDLSALVLQELQELIKAQFDAPIESLVITVPAYFNSIQREQTLAAADLAGLSVSRLINEPTAAALAYGLQDRDAESTFVVLDLGGGTFDVSILEMFDGVMEVRASSGDAFLGGEDFTLAIALHIAEEHDLRFQKLKALEQEKILSAAEQIKQSLSSQADATASLEIGKSTFDITITRAQFEDVCGDLTARLRSTDRTLLV
ncbi:Hsp70 family protein [Yoonia sp. GPGPB17]|uniref:Hsp70 family protein n=1 Tax=Yoonia sp. GPGPB17 TaxID=3026147 RepID=UPI0030C40497